MVANHVIVTVYQYKNVSFDGGDIWSKSPWQNGSSRIKASVANTEQKRKARRKIEQRYKAKKKGLAVATRKAGETNSSDVDGLDVCTDDEI